MAVSERDLEHPDAAKKRTASTLRHVRAHFGLSNVQLGKRAGMATSTVRSKMEETPCWSWEVERFAAAFGVPVSVLHMGPNEAVSWLEEHRPGRRSDLPPFPTTGSSMSVRAKGAYVSSSVAA